MRVPGRGTGSGRHPFGAPRERPRKRGRDRHLPGEPRRRRSIRVAAGSRRRAHRPEHDRARPVQPTRESPPTRGRILAWRAPRAPARRAPRRGPALSLHQAPAGAAQVLCRRHAPSSRLLNLEDLETPHSAGDHQPIVRRLGRCLGQCPGDRQMSTRRPPSSETAPTRGARARTWSAIAIAGRDQSMTRSPSASLSAYVGSPVCGRQTTLPAAIASSVATRPAAAGPASS